MSAAPDRQVPEREDPDWSLLPNRPVEFFGLTGDFDKRDLKRAYNRLLKRFKPERHPDEFQLIRAAYERLDDYLRYHVREELDQAAQEQQPQWGRASRPDEGRDGGRGAPRSGSAAEPGASGTRGARSPAGEGPDREGPTDEPVRTPDSPSQPALGPNEQLVAELEADGPAAVFGRRARRPDGTAQHYFHLALISDLLEPPPARGFFDWVLAGLEAHPSDGRLLQLLYAYCHRPEAWAEARYLVTRCAASLSLPAFGYVTERLWFHLAGELPFDEFRRLFESCLRSSRDPDSDGRAVLTARLLRRLVLRADPTWADQQLGFLWECQNRGVDLDEHFLFLDLLLEYRDERDDFLDGSEFRADVDELIVAISERDVEEADRLFLEWRVKYRTRGEEVLEALPIHAEHAVSALIVLRQYSHELDWRLGQPAPALGDGQRIRTVGGFARRVDVLTRRTLIGWLYGANGALGILVLPIALVATAFGLGSSHGLEPPAVWFAMLGYLVAFGLAYWFGFVRKLWPAFDRWLDTRCHARIWRSELLAFLEHEPVSASEVVTSLRYDKSLEAVSVAGDLASQIEIDAGLAFVSLLRHRR